MLIMYRNTFFMASKLEKIHAERFPDELLNSLVKVPELNDETIPFTVYKALQWKSDPWQWIIDQVLTVDESDNSIKPFPNFEYLQFIVELYFTRKIIVVPKTRRMLLTHTFLSGVLVHQLLFQENSDNIFVSISEEKAKKAFRKRAKKTIEHLDPRWGIYPNFREGSTLLSSSARNPDNGSELSAIPSGADKCRGDTLNNAVYDEFAFQEYCEDNLKALKPALEGKNCRGAIISSPKPGTVFEDLTKIKEGSKFTQLMQGLSCTENEFNHLVIKCHYLAHPYKRSKEWYHKERYGTTPDGTPLPGASGVDTFTWLQEYEGEFNFPRGDRAIHEFSEELHCKPYHQICPDGYIKNRPLDISFDFGSRFPTVAFTQMDNRNRYIIHDGLMVYNERQSAFLERTKRFLNDYFPDWEEDFNLFCDPSGFKETRGGNADPEAIDLERFFNKKVKNRPRTDKQKFTYQPIHRVRSLNEQAAMKCGDAHGIVINPSAGRWINEMGKEEYGIIPKAFAYGYCFKKKNNVKSKGHTDSGLELDKDGFFDHYVDTLGYPAVFYFPCREIFKDKIQQLNKKPAQPKRKSKATLRW